LREDHERPFDLENGPICRASIYSRASTQHYFLLCVHHIALDGWSLWQLLDEIQQAYRQALSSFISESPQLIDLPPTSATYLNFIVKQRAFLNSAQGQAQIKQWLDELPR